MSENYSRIKIDGIITTQTEMTVASGLQESQSSIEDSPLHSEICLDFNDKPYIPGSSLRGLLVNLCPDTTLREILFGGGGENSSSEGKVRIYDAVWGENANYEKGQQHTHSSINPMTGTAKDHHLFNDAIVPLQSQFNWTIEANNIAHIELEYLYGLLYSLHHNPQVQLGKGQSKQSGLFNWQAKSKKIDILSQTSLINWLKQEDNKSFCYIQKKIKPKTIELKIELTEYPLTFTALSPILINDPERVSGESEKPSLVYYQKGQQLIIPASSFKGVIRSHCRKIILTLIMADKEGYPKNSDNKLANKLLAELFGDTNQKSRIWTQDVIAENTESKIQTFNAVDRFTGGIADSALYKVEGAAPNRLTTVLIIDQAPKRYSVLKAWQKGLLALLLKDAIEGDLTVGWGKAKGYGSIQLTTVNIKGEEKDWNAIIKHFGEETIQQWLNNLNEECQTCPKEKECA